MSMLLDLNRLRGGGGRVDRLDPPETFDAPNEDFRVVAPVVFEADVQKDKEKVRLIGRVATELEVSCSRCLEPFRMPIDAAFNLLFLPMAGEVATSDDTQLAEDDATASFYENDTIDLAQVIREQFYLALPMKPLCRVDCQGLCPVCGINRNTATCSCESEWVDPRMEALRRIAEKQSGH